jgi:hypothetical protein
MIEALVIVLGLLLGALAAAYVVQDRRPSPGERAAAAIQQGMASAQVPDADEAADDVLSGSQDEAGYRWAERHGLDDAGACPSYTPAFRAGCAAYVKDQAP